MWSASFFTAKKTINTMNRQYKDWQKIFANDVIEKGLISKIQKELIQLNNNNQNPNNPTEKWAQYLNANQNYNEVPPHTDQSGHH